MMKASLSLVTILCLCAIRASALDPFNKKFIAVKKADNVTLRCEKATDKAVTWKFEDQPLEPAADIKMEGNNMTLLKLDLDLTGIFTCWSEEQKVDDTYVLLDMSDFISDSPISCTAETFNCTSTISCTMSEKGYQYFRLRNGDDWLKPSSEGKFYLTHTTNPFAEEATPIVVIGEGMSDLNHYFNTSYSFYIRDIIRPGCPRVSVLKKENGSMLDLKPPVTWILPLSYYPLEHEIQFVSRTDGQITQVNYTHSCVGKRRPKKSKNQKKKEEKKKKGHKSS
ncbi:interleukin-12 subunit beta-like isoform X2 [Silurus asotus]|uniref:Interleukin-12 subunit beta-like isoform X2 n=1 Tax=Silurus asotus TaxID=30991 RepID=A0AAD5FQE0_SILAS|nr:interleukin-12 subunit beta-like isoform X2 [Silurus asotus]